MDEPLSAAGIPNRLPSRATTTTKPSAAPASPRPSSPRSAQEPGQRVRALGARCATGAAVHSINDNDGASSTCITSTRDDRRRRARSCTASNQPCSGASTAPRLRGRDRIDQALRHPHPRASTDSPCLGPRATRRSRRRAGGATGDSGPSPRCCASPAAASSTSTRVSWRSACSPTPPSTAARGASSSLTASRTAPATPTESASPRCSSGSLIDVVDDLGAHMSTGRHGQECDSSCPDCLRSYDNRHLHPLLDWRLGLDLAELAAARPLQTDRWLRDSKRIAEGLAQAFELEAPRARTTLGHPRRRHQPHRHPRPSCLDVNQRPTRTTATRRRRSRTR